MLTIQRRYAGYKAPSSMKRRKVCEEKRKKSDKIKKREGATYDLFINTMYIKYNLTRDKMLNSLDMYGSNQQ